MKEFVEKLIERLEDSQAKIEFALKGCKVNEFIQVKAVKRIIVELAEECINCSTDTSTNTSSGWIPCSEKLPERTKPFQTNEYTVTMRMITKVGKCSPFSSHASFDYETGKWLVKGFEVIAWQPLPKVYKSKEGES